MPSADKDDMIQRFKSFIESGQLCTEKDNILVAVSGGIDSMVMLHLFLKAGYRVGVAHCNFKLRGKESDGDQQFVVDFAGKHKIPCHTTSFETKKYAIEKGISIQMAARDLRYRWLEGIKQENDYEHIAVGHNSDDSIETFFINLSRNAGIHGLTGIKHRFKDVIRPLLFATRKEISHYAGINQISYREDSSNKETKYLRNKIRHHIIPEFERLNPTFRENMQEVIFRFRELEKQLTDMTAYYQNIAMTIADEKVKIDFTKFPSEDIMTIVLFEMVKDYGFNGDQVRSMIESVHGESGKQFFSGSFRLVKDRNEFIITRKQKASNKAYSIEEGVSQISMPVMLTFKMISKTGSFKILTQPNMAFLDYDKLVFPLRIRKWNKGDRFIPFGMTHFKKLSDFFTDNKLSLIEKESVWLIESGNDIVWIINHRIDNRYRITNETQHVYKIISGNLNS